MAIARGSITDDDRNFTETWENIAVHQNAVIKLNRRGDEVQEVITGRRTFMLTTEERVITQDRISDPTYDPFLNGSFRPVLVPDTIDIESNPNALSDEEIGKLFAASDFAFAEWLDTIDSAQTLRRMIDLAPDADNLSLKRFNEIQRRYATVKPKTRLGTNDRQLETFLSDRPSGGGANNTTTTGAANPRRQGGRSSDYR
jgi:hypothetical protein